VVAGLFTTSVAAQNISTSSLAGCYFKKSQTSDMAAVESKLTTVYSHLNLKRLSATNMEFDLLVSGANFHGCSARGEVTLKKESNTAFLELVHAETDLLDKNNLSVKACRLRIYVNPRDLITEDPNPNNPCNDVFVCGARAGVGGERFLRKSKTTEKDKVRCSLS
jgi:hypothetical protein